MNRFLSIPTFRSMKYLHGILFAGAMWVLVVLWATHYLILPDHTQDPEVVLVRWAMLMTGFILVPPLALFYRIVSTNQY